jgi:outer membrane lipoprotein SlyB
MLLLTHKTTHAVAAAILLLALSACSTSTSPDVVRRQDAQQLSTVLDATVLSVRAVTIEGRETGLGGAAGSVIGGVAGASVGGRREGTIVGVLGAVAGAVAGTAVERMGNREHAVEIVLQIRGGDRRAIVQAAGSDIFAPGDAVMLVTSGSVTRVTKVAPR